MKIFDRTAPGVIGNDLKARLVSDVAAAFASLATKGDQFIVNDRLWYWKNPRGAAMPTVVNQAEFLSKGFQKGLVLRGWTREFEAHEQRIDGFIELRHEAEAYKLPPTLYVEFLAAYEREVGESSGPLATHIYRGYCQRTAFTLGAFPEALHKYFDRTLATHKVRVGLEFETGNIASSFRALHKLDFLYLENSIDIAVFITSESKAGCAARIWPVSNRNGSFEELERRNYKGDLVAPLVAIGFEPDGFDADAPYLSSDGSTYLIQPTDRVIDIESKSMAVFDANGRDVFILDD